MVVAPEAVAKAGAETAVVSRIDRLTISSARRVCTR